jgi:hypothetical protein
MDILVRRIHDNGDATIGLVYINCVLKGFTLEDEYRDVKIECETRIPSGIYKLKKREIVSGLTQKYRDKYNWFDFHLEVQDVPGFKYVYVHVGNYESNTDGCLLVGDSANIPKMSIGNSVNCFKRMYLEISKALDNDEEVIIEYV